MTLNYSTDILSRPQALNVTNLFGQIVSEVINPVELTLGQLSPFGPGPQGHVWRHFSGRQSSEEYWRTHLMDADSAAIFLALLAGDYVPVVDHSLHSVFPTTTTDDPSVLICAAWAIVQAHHTDSSNIIFAATRDISQKAEQEMVPCCLRVLPDDPISSVLSAIRRHRTEAAGLSQTARQSLLKEFPDSRGVAFSVQEASHSLLSPHSSPSSLPHSLTIIASIHQDDSLRLTAQFDSRVMSDVECQRLLQQLEHVFNSVATGDPYQQIGQVSVISPQDLALLKEWNRTPPTPLNRCVHDLIMDRCESNPAALSISAWDGCFTYGELRDLSGRLATHLLKQSGGAVRTAKVPVCMEKSQVVPVAILAVLRAGATCVMVDPSQPLQRVHALTKDLAAPLAVVSSSGASAMNEIVANPIVVSSAMLNTLPPSSTPFPAVNPQSPAFIVFTSGSTGKPKGIVMRHYNISSALRDLPLSHNVTTGLLMLHFASYAFDASLSETFLTLSTGSCLCIPSEFDRTNDLSGFIREQNINWAILTSSAAAVLHPADVPSLQTLLLVGEPLPSRAVDLWAADRTLINGYGPAECSFACAVGRVPSRGWKPGTIGPVVNGLGWITTVSDPSRLAAIGAVGELLVEGPSVTAGYLDEPEKTAASFIPGPAWLQDFRNDTTATRLYRTGDLVQFTGGGEIRFVGRRDTQVKLNGQRIELGEVEHNVRAGFPDGTVVIAEVVTPAGDHPRPLLVAFVCIQPSQKKSNDHPVEAVPVPNDLFRFQVEAARTHFLSVLPRHMVPAAFLPLNYIPFSAAGKADRRRLREMAGSMSRTELEKFMASECKSSSSSPPSTGLERLLQQLFAQVLRVPPESISSEHSFFQLGGDSVVAMALVSMARRAGVRISIANVFRHPRLSDLASIIKIDSEVVPSKQAAEDGQRGLDQKLASYASSYLALSSREALLESVLRSCQSHLSADDISEVLPVTGFQNMELRGQPCIYRILHFDKPLDYDRLEAACQALMQRHSILRTTFQPHGDTALQIVHVHPEARLQRMYLAVHDPQYVERVCTAQENDKGTFNTPITQFTIVQGLSPIHHSLIIRLSHAQYDGVSMPMLYNDLKCLYEGSPLPQATPFTAHMEHWLDAQGSQSALSYWQGLLEASSMTYLRDPSLPQDRKDPTDNNLVMVKRQCHLGDSLTKKAGITTATLVKAAWAFVLMQITQQNDVTFAQTVSTRKLDAPNTTNVVGPCINHVPVRVPLQHSWTILDLLQYVQNQHTESEPFNIFDHSSIVDRCSAWSKKNSFGSLVTHQNIDTGPSSGSSFSIGNAECVSVDSSLGEKLHLPPHETVMVTTFPGTGNLGLVIQLEASSRTLGPKYANVVVQHLENAIQHFVGSPSTNISALLS